MSGVTFVKGVVVASLAAGPLFVTGMLLPGASSADRIVQMLLLTLLLYGFSLVYGFVLSLLPNMIGAMALATLGRRVRWTRSPLVSAAVGGALGIALQLGVAGQDDAGLGLPIMVPVGTLCALICRWGTRWAD